jgi:hypothetical protein
MIKRHTYSSIKALKYGSIKALKLGDINRDTKQDFRETEYKKAERQICFNCPYADCEKGYCDRIKKFRKEWVKTHNNTEGMA